MTNQSDTLASESTAGIRRKAYISPAVVTSHGSFSPLSTPPDPIKEEELGIEAVKAGFSDGDTPQSNHILKTIGYQHASCYFDMFRDSDGRIDNGSMRLLHRAILFDRKLQALTLEYIGLFELKFRAQYSYAMSEKYGAFAHRQANNFKVRSFFDSFLDKYFSELSRRISSDSGELSKTAAKYGDLPIWSAVEVMSFGTLSKLYSNTRSASVKKRVAKSFGCSVDEFESWIKAISSARNTCAHFGRFCGRKLSRRPKRIEGVDFDNGNPFYIILLLAKLLKCTSTYDDETLAYGLWLVRDVAQLLVDFSDVACICGIPSNWDKLILSETITGIVSVFGDDWLRRDATTGRVWFRVRSDSGTSMCIGKSI